MQRRSLVLGGLALIPMGASAHHKPDHGTPPGHGTTPPDVVIDPITGLPVNVTNNVTVGGPSSSGAARRRKRRKSRRRR